MQCAYHRRTVRRRKHVFQVQVFVRDSVPECHYLTDFQIRFPHYCAVKAGLMFSICPRERPFSFASRSQLSLTIDCISSDNSFAFDSDSPNLGATLLTRGIEILLSLSSTNNASYKDRFIILRHQFSSSLHAFLS